MDNKYTNKDIFNTTECPSDALLLRYVKETISKEDKRTVELHLVDCEMCSDMVEGYQRIHPQQISDNIKSIELNIDKAVAAHKASKAGASAFKWYYAAAAILIIGLTGILYNTYFNSIKESEVAIVTVSPKIENKINPDTLVIEDDTMGKAPIESNSVKTVKSVQSINTEDIESVTLESKNTRIPAQDEVLALSESPSDDMASEPVETKREEKPQMPSDAEGTTKSLADNTTLGTIPVVTAVTNVEALTSGSAVCFSSPVTIQTNINPVATDGNSFNYILKKENTSKAKFKAKASTANAKNEQKKDRQEDFAKIGKEGIEPATALQEANQLLKQKKYNEALLKFNQYLKLFPKNCDAVNGAAQCYDATNKKAEAIIYYTKLSQLKCGKQADAAYLKLSELYFKNNQPNEAKQVLKKAMQSKYLDIAEQAKKELGKL